MERETGYKKLQPKKLPSTSVNSNEQRFGGEFKKVLVTKHHAKITHLSYCPVAPNDLAVTSSTRVQVCDPLSGEAKKTITRFKDVAYCGSWRGDGKLMVAGSEDSSVQVFDMNSRTVLRSFRGHSGPVQLSRFGSDRVSVVTGSDDATVRYWDMATGSEVVQFSEHKDYVRCGQELPNAAGQWITGSYDHTVRLWDSRAKQSVMSMDHGFPVGDVLVLPSGGIAISAGDNQMRVWDLVSGGRLLHSLSNHQKSITALSLDQTGSRLLSASLDHFVKFYDLANYQVTHSIKYSGPILSMAISPSNTSLAVGLVDGTLSIRSRQPKSSASATSAASVSVFSDAAKAEEEKKKTLRGGTTSFFLRGANATASHDDVKVDVGKKQRLQPHDAFLKKFQYKEALDAALQTHNPNIIVSLLEELLQRGSLPLALANRDDRGLEPVLRFLYKQIANPPFTSLLVDVTNIVLDLYTSSLGQSIVIDELFVKLKEQTQNEAILQQQLQQLLGSISALVSSSQVMSQARSLAAIEAGAVPPTL